MALVNGPIVPAMDQVILDVNNSLVCVLGRLVLPAVSLSLRLMVT